MLFDLVAQHFAYVTGRTAVEITVTTSMDNPGQEERMKYLARGLLWRGCELALELGMPSPRIDMHWLD